MKKIKIVAMLIVAMFVGLTATSASGVEYLNADIDILVRDFVGIVTPMINVTSEEQKNQTVTFEVNVTEPVDDPENNSYIVEDELVINLTIDDQSGRDALPFIIPRFVVYRVVIARDFMTALKMPTDPFGSMLKRWLPVKVPFASANVVDTIGGLAATNITIPVNYKVDNLTYYSPEGENMTMYVTVVGFIPGNTDGFIEDVPIIDREIINLKVMYEEKAE